MHWEPSSHFIAKENDLLPLFCMGDYFVYCNDIKGIMAAMKCKYNTEDWNDFIDRLKTSLKNVLLHTMCFFYIYRLGIL